MMVLEAGNRPLPNNAGGAELEFHKGHGLCGALGKDADLDVNATISPNAFFTEGDVIDVDVTLESHRKGHFEFRLCSLDANDFSQECLNEHVLEFDATFTAASYSGQMEDAMRWSPADLLENEACKSDDGAPLGSCCNHGGACSDGAHNRHRWAVPSSAAGPMYTMRLVLPRGVRCEHCVLQWFYQTGDGRGSFHGYPEGFWDCADVAIREKTVLVPSEVQRRKLLAILPASAKARELGSDDSDVEVGIDLSLLGETTSAPTNAPSFASTSAPTTDQAQMPSSNETSIDDEVSDDGSGSVNIDDDEDKSEDDATNSAATVSTALIVGASVAKGFISFPPSRKMMVLEAGNRPLPNNAGGAELEFYKGHGLCGALGKDADLDVNATISPNAFFTEGDVIDVDVTLESHRKGHFEFRLCSLDANDFSQECLNEHVLEFDATFTAASYSGQMEDAMRWSPADLLENEACKSDDGTPLGSDAKNVFMAKEVEAVVVANGQPGKHSAGEEMAMSAKAIRPVGATNSKTLAVVAALVLSAAVGVRGEGFLLFPPSRNLVYNGGSRGENGIDDMDAGGAQAEFSNGHGLCGDQSWRREMQSPNEFGGGLPLVTYAENSTIEINVTITTHRKGYFEFRLCDLDDDGLDLNEAITQSCLNEYVLEFDIEYTESSYKDQMEDGRTSPADYKGSGGLASSSEAYKCKNLYASPTGSCCNNGGDCSQPNSNKERWVVPLAEAGPVYTMRYSLPEGVTCDRCVLQWYYQTGDDEIAYDAPNGLATFLYPAGTWNCADIAIVPESANISTPVNVSNFYKSVLLSGEEESIEIASGQESCQSATGDDHALCRFYECSQALISNGMCVNVQVNSTEGNASGDESDSGDGSDSSDGAGTKTGDEDADNADSFVPIMAGAVVSIPHRKHMHIVLSLSFVSSSSAAVAAGLILSSPPKSSRSLPLDASCRVSDDALQNADQLAGFWDFHDPPA
ncbi:Hypothetical Protein FCC1311_052042 [Hondaea fermentalgiana]|uniref:Chitin-binding type-4 domain-containing protein n=1 Tax=Hondaea fermentalgiana TaxID=2315210 RepID=A0A2R5GK21_9STRA|nr:Hypothetical Protein FCC1311_052042 [Hondaea fermentalgiana]|eukprot:GBG28983.1 Hypothetical Protein FCC1311_052042 [Hondaea fermentalgiana]